MDQSKSTSIHSLNADKGLSKPQKIIYIFLNWINNLFDYTYLDPRLAILFYKNQNWDDHWSQTYKESSPGRRLSDLFWRTLPWEKIKEELGEIHIFDTGCGHGNYGPRLLEASGGLIDTYTGIDVKRRPNWSDLEKKYSSFHFIESDSTDILPLIPPQANFFITQSAIEHFENDLVFFEQVKNFIDRDCRPIIQIHNFPSKAILPLYLFHGVRQYTPRTVSKITRLFQGNTRFYLIGLGGRAAKKIQFWYFTWPLLILRKKARWSDDVEDYDMKVRQALEKDAKHPSRSPLFWVLAIQHNLKKPLW